MHGWKRLTEPGWKKTASGSEVSSWTGQETPALVFQVAVSFDPVPHLAGDAQSSLIHSW